jgi:ribosomal protein L12E/L44/L45/RPP1/RPP2
MSDAEKLRAKAAHARHLAEQVTDVTAAANLEKFAVELLEQATKLDGAGAHPPAGPPQRAPQQQQQPKRDDKRDEQKDDGKDDEA